MMLGIPLELMLKEEADAAAVPVVVVTTGVVVETGSLSAGSRPAPITGVNICRFLTILPKLTWSL